MDPAGSLDATTWAALALTLTVLGAVLSFLAWRRRGPAAGLRGVAWTLLPVAAWLTGTLRLAVAVGEEVVGWATRLVFSPTVWTGIGVLGVSVLLFVVTGAMRTRGVGARDRVRAPRDRRAVGATEPAPTAVTTRATKATKAPKGARTPKRGTTGHESDLDDMDDIEAILKKHGI